MGVTKEVLTHVPIVGGFIEHPLTRFGLVGTVVGAGMVAFSGMGIEADTTVEAGHGTVTSVVPLREFCTAGYDAKMQDVKAHYGVTLKAGHISIPTFYSEQVEYNGTIGNKVCHDAADIKLAKPGDRLYKDNAKDCDGKKLCAFLGGKYTITTFEQVPGRGYDVTSNGLTMAMARNLVNSLNVLPLHIKGDNIDDSLRGVAFLSAQETSSTRCLQAASKVVRHVQQQSVARTVTNLVNGAADFYGRSAELNPDGSDVAVVDESAVSSATSQYANLVKKVKAADKHLRMTEGKVGSCEMSPALKRQYHDLDNQGNVRKSS